MKKFGFLISLSICLALLSVTASFAQQQTYKIAVVNSTKAFETSTEGKKAYAQFMERDNKIKADLQKQDDAIRALENRMNTGRLTMTPEAITATQVDHDKKVTERKRYEEDATRDFGTLQQNVATKIRDELLTIVKALRKEKGYDVIFDLQPSGIADFEPALDITDELVRRYDASKASAAPVAPKRLPSEVNDDLPVS
jgi:Skp family chaperone for outer membrane proteins